MQVQLSLDTDWLPELFLEGEYACRLDLSSKSPCYRMISGFAPARATIVQDKVCWCRKSAAACCLVVDDRVYSIPFQASAHQCPAPDMDKIGHIQRMSFDQ